MHPQHLPNSRPNPYPQNKAGNSAHINTATSSAAHPPADAANSRTFSSAAAAAMAPVEGAPVSLMDRILGYIMDERSALREEMAGRAAAAEVGRAATGSSNAAGDSGGAGGRQGEARGRGPAVEFQRKVTPCERVALLSDLFGVEGEGEASGGAAASAAGGEAANAAAGTSCAVGSSGQHQQPFAPLRVSEASQLAAERTGVMEATGAGAQQLDAAGAAANGELWL